MSGGLDILALQEDDVTKMLAATTHVGSDKVNFQMEQYVFKRRPDGVHIINLGRTWEKLLLAARAIAAIEHPQDVSPSRYLFPRFFFKLNTFPFANGIFYDEIFLSIIFRG